MIRPFLEDPLFRGIPGRGLTGSLSLTDITFAGQRHVMPLRRPVAKATGRVGISQREEREMDSSKTPEQNAAEPAYWCHVCMTTVPVSQAASHTH